MDGVRTVFGQQAGDERLIADVTFDEHMVRIVVQRGQGLQIARVGQRIQVDDAHAFGDCFEDKVTANESGSAGDKPCGHYPLSCLDLHADALSRPDSSPQAYNGTVSTPFLG